MQRVFGELALRVGPRVDTQLAANYEFYNVAGRHVSSFDPKVGGRLQIAENLQYSLALRGSVQTTFRTPSLDDLNPSPLTTLEWISETGAYQAVDRFGQPDLLPEQAFTYNLGAVLFLEGGVEATVDYWSYDFENVIGSMPYDAVTSLYNSDDPATRNALSPFIVCPEGKASDLLTCPPLRRQEPRTGPARSRELARAHHLRDRHPPRRPLRRRTGPALGQLGCHLHGGVRDEGLDAGGHRPDALHQAEHRRLLELCPPDRGAAAPLEEPLVGVVHLERLHGSQTT